MPNLFRRHTTVSCFFCQSIIHPQPKNLSSFRCPHCRCSNRYDSNGEIHSEEPAMFDEALNPKSFAKHASPTKDRLPTVYGRGPFCHICQTNQMLLVNLLANYLPSPHHPEYAKRLELLPEYENSLHSRYPPVCPSCLPLVEEEIKSKDHMARTRALGGWLRESKGKQKQVSTTNTTEKTKVGRTIFLVWRIRGCLWAATLTLALFGNSAAAVGLSPPPRLISLLPALPAFVLTSILWTAWDPTYSSLRTAQLQGRDVRVTGKKTYIILQMTAWFSRLLTSLLLGLSYFLPHRPPSYWCRVYFSLSLVLELTILILSSATLRLRRPPLIRLINTNTHKFPSSRQTPDPVDHPTLRRSPAPALPDPDLLATLSLSSKPVIATNPTPVFGYPSLLPPVGNTANDDADAMDWTPTNPSSSNRTRNDDGAWMRPQRFFPPEQPTGLENLMARTGLRDDLNSHQSRDAAHLWNWWWVYAISLMPLVGVAYKAWDH